MAFVSRLLSQGLQSAAKVRKNVRHQQLAFASTNSSIIDEEMNIDRELTGKCPFAGKSMAATQASGAYRDRPVNYRKAKKFDEVPKPYSLPLLGSSISVMREGGTQYLHEYIDRRHKELGPIFKDRTSAFNSIDIVFIASNKLMQHVYLNEGKHPIHLVPESWTLYNQVKNVQRGLFFMDGPEWRQLRSILEKMFLDREHISKFTSVFNEVITDLIYAWTAKSDHVTSANGETKRIALIDELEKDLYKWSIESLGAMIFGRRLGCIPSAHVLSSEFERLHEFVACVQQIFVESAKMTLIPAKYAYKFNLPMWKRFERAANGAITLARSYVEENMRNTSRSETADSVLKNLFAEKHITREMVCSIIVDLFIAAADTTSHGTQWSLYLLAKNPQCQQRLYDEINSAIKKDEIIEERHLKQLPYVRCIIKEALRLYPIAPFISRIITRDIVLGGYHVPKGKLIAMSLYTTGRDEKYFKDAQSFKPERWFRDPSKTLEERTFNAYACLPFGFGPRSCIGRRVAELQMQLLLARTVQKFKLEPECEEDINIKLRMITTPEKAIHLRFKERD
ncbi:cytochrome P450 315a1-like protein [Dinothrombium tinctorium]|uniref:Cytochrome P450 315a1-like protein n=1 Tax=Dinothrombium tinctorium TaxID=1965070 RepID=A0A3S3P737_9ACAR|nr:cytochrome P450 315a1-like protein [Dinothrombium tinctorium]